MNPYKIALYSELARREFWIYCKLMAPDFYKESRTYLKELCDTLQALYEKRIQRTGKSEPWQIFKEHNPDLEYCRNFMLNMPPQHGKSRTLTLFISWVFGKNNNERVITGSYNDSTSSDFSRYTRDTIATEKNLQTDIDYSDIFPKTTIKTGHGGFEKWALEGQHFNYLGVGVGGSVTSKGATIQICDDLIKGAIEAMNINILEKTWLWYSGTFASRISAEGGEALIIFNMTRWSKNDPCGKLLSLSNADKWFVYKRTIMDESGNMLCDELMSNRAFEDLKITMPDFILRANYFQEPIDLKGRLYPEFKTYVDIPRNEKLQSIFKEIKNYTDTADEGSDYLCSITYAVFMNDVYILDVYYTNENMQTTDIETARRFAAHKVNHADIESNNGGKGFAISVGKYLKDTYKTFNCNVSWFHQSENKLARILSNSATVLNCVLMPQNWIERWPLFAGHLLSFSKDSKNTHDDAPDALTGVVETLNKPSFFAGVAK